MKTPKFSIVESMPVSIHSPLQGSDSLKETKFPCSFLFCKFAGISMYYKIILLLVTGLLFSNFLYAQITFTVNGIKYITTSTTTVAVTSGGTYVNDVKIPSNVIYLSTTYQVTSIADNAFYNCKNLTSVNIASSITTIGQYAFYGCSGFLEIIIPASVVSIGEGAFNMFAGLISVDEANTVYSGMNGILYNKSKTQLIVASTFISGNFTVPNSATSIGYCAFLNCTGLKSVTMPNSVTTIAVSAFQGCTSLTDVIIPSSVTSIGNYAFSGCTSLATIRTFAEAPVGLSSTNIFTNVNKSTCTLYVAAGTKSLYQKATVWLDFVNIVEMLTIGTRFNVNGIYYKVTGFNSVSVTNNGHINIWDNNLYSGNISLPSKVSYSQSVYNVTGIADSTFMASQKLKNVIIPGSVTSLGNYSFNRCDSLKSVTIPSSVNYIGAYTFEYCQNLQEITIPGMVDSIKENTFYSCGIMSIKLPKSLKYIGQQAFYNSGLQSIVIPDSVITIDKTAFFACSALTDVILGNSVKTIGNDAFFMCYNLKSINIPASVDTIGITSFQECYELRNINIPASVKCIGYRAFNNPLINVDDNNPNYSSLNGVLYNKLKTVL